MGQQYDHIQKSLDSYVDITTQRDMYIVSINIGSQVGLNRSMSLQPYLLCYYGLCLNILIMSRICKGVYLDVVSFAPLHLENVFVFFSIIQCLISIQYCNLFRVDLSLPVLLDDPILNKIAAKYNRSPAEVAMRFVLQKGVVVLAKSFNPNRIKQNLGVTTASYYVVLNCYLL